MSLPRPKFALNAPIEGEFADAALLAELAADAERAGWDGFFIMDHLIRRQPWQAMVDPWVAMTAIAIATERIALGPMVTPLARRRPAVLARQTATLDQLSEGRLILGVGLGAPDDEFTRFGESADPRHRAKLLDESLELLALLWSGEEITYNGELVQAEGVQFLPRPVKGTIPVWVAGIWPGGPPFRRAARYEGIWPIAGMGNDFTLEAFTEMNKALAQMRVDAGTADQPFDVCYSALSPGPDDQESIEFAGQLVDAGMTWWVEPIGGRGFSMEQVRERITAGPPRV